MLEYQNLSPLEFEYLCQDVMQERLQVPLRRFPAGKDGGIDLVDSLSSCGVLVQVKHYLKSPFSTLRQALRKELPKVRALNPGQYFICCAQTLSPAQVKEIYQLFSDYMASERNIVTLLEIDDFLCDEKNAALLRKHFKLWLSATHILSELYNQHIFVDAEALLYDVREELPYYVQTESYWKSKAILEAERLLMILGNPGVGKTTVSKMLVLYFASIGYRVRYTTNGDLSDIKRSLSADPELREIVLLDDCLGQCYFRLRDTQESELSALIKYIKFHPSKMLLLNSRVTIFNEAREQAPAFSQLFDRGAISIRRIDAEDIPLREKALILYALMRKFQVPDSYYQSIRSDKKYRQIIQHPNYNPRIIEYAAWRYQDAGAPEAFFSFLMDKIQSPKNVWKDEFERRLDPVDRYFMYTLHSLAVPRPYVSMDAMRQAYQKVLEAIHADISLNHFENVLSRLSRSLVRIVSREQRVVYSREPYHWTFVPDDSQELAVLNPSVSDYLEDVFREPALRRFFKANACYLEQLIHMCNSREEIDAEVKRLSDSGQLDRIRTIQPELTCPLILYSTVRFRITDPQLDPYILPGLLNFPTHYYISSSFMLSHQKRQLMLCLHRLGEALQRRREHVAEREVCGLDLAGPLIHPGQQQQILHEAAEADSLLLDVSAPLVFSVIELHGLGVGLDNGQRGLDLVARIGDELLLLLHALRNRADGPPGEKHHQQQHGSPAGSAQRNGQQQDPHQGQSLSGSVQKYYRAPHGCLVKEIPELSCSAAVLSTVIGLGSHFPCLLLRHRGGSLYIGIQDISHPVKAHHKKVGGEKRIIVILRCLHKGGRPVRPRRYTAGLAIGNDSQGAIHLSLYNQHIGHIDGPQQEQQQHRNSCHSRDDSLLLERLYHSVTSSR